MNMGRRPPIISQKNQPSPSNPQGAALCLVFTDARGRIVFVDNNFLDLLGQNDATSLVGEPLYKILNVAPQKITELIAAIAQTGYIRDRSIEIQALDELLLRVACTGVATYDDQGAFVGADLTLYNDTQLMPSDVQFVDHGDILSARIKEIQDETEKQWQEEEHLSSLSYFTAQVMAIQVLLGRMGGPRVREMVEILVNQTANQHGWRVQLRGGHITVEEKAIPLDAYAVLMEQVIDYGTSIIGEQAILHEMQEVDIQMTAHEREVAGQAGLRRWLGC
jgi:hypothetical protein